MRNIEWWIKFLPKWNGRSFIYDNITTYAHEISLYTDASDKGYGILYGNKWIAQPWPNNVANRLDYYNIDWRELFAIFVCVHTFSHAWTGKCLTLYSDNLSNIQTLSKGSSKSPIIMVLLRYILFHTALNNISIHFQFLPGHKNEAADLDHGLTPKYRARHSEHLRHLHSEHLRYLPWLILS